MVSGALCESKDIKERDRGCARGGEKEESASQKGGGIQKGEKSTS